MKSLSKALDILELFSQNRDEMSLAEIAQLSGLSKPTAYRIVSIFVQRGYLQHRRKRAKYSLGNIFLEFSGVIKGKAIIRDIAIPHVIELSQLVNEAVLIAVWDVRTGVFTETFHEISHSSDPLKVVPEEGASLPMHCTSAGKIILAYMSEEELTTYFRDKQLESRTPNTITDINELKKQLKIVRQENVAYDDEEYSLGMRGVSSVIKDDQSKVVGALSVVGPSVRLNQTKMKNLAPIVKNYALRISRELGYPGNSFHK